MPECYIIAEIRGRVGYIRESVYHTLSDEQRAELHILAVCPGRAECGWMLHDRPRVYDIGEWIKGERTLRR